MVHRIGLVSLACCLAMFSCLCRAEEPKQAAAAAPPKLKVTVAKETTYITEPLRPDGYPDYFAALNQRMSAGVTPENNAAVLLVRAMGPPDQLKSSGTPRDSKRAAAFKSHRAEYYQLLGIDPLPDEGDYFVTSGDLLKRWEDERFDKEGTFTSQEERDRIGSEFGEAMSRPWKGDEFPKVLHWILINQKPLELIRQSMRRNKCFFPLIGHDALLGAAHRPELDPLENIASFLRANAMRELVQGHLEEAWRDVMYCHRLARFLDAAVLDSFSLDAFWMEEHSIAADAAIAHFGKPSPKLARQMQADFQALEPFGKILDKSELCSRFERLDSAVELARERPKGLGIAIADTLFGPAIDVDLVLKLNNEWFDREYAALRLTDKDARATALNAVHEEIEKIKKEHSLQDLQKQWLPKDVVSRRIAAEMAGLYQNPGTYAWFERQQAMWRELGETAMALAVYRADTGNYPQTLADIVPKYMARVPVDTFAKSPKPIQYRREDDAYALWHSGIGKLDPDSGDAKDGPGQSDIVLRPVAKKDNGN